ncbi:MAG: hypothetical protein AB7E47_17445 [Desulfovibrionaceae bacterium]
MKDNQQLEFETTSAPTSEPSTASATDGVRPTASQSVHTCVTTTALQGPDRFKCLPPSCHTLLQNLIETYGIGRPFITNCPELSVRFSLNSGSVQRSLQRLALAELVQKQQARIGAFQGFELLLLPACNEYLFTRNNGFAPTSATSPARPNSTKIERGYYYSSLPLEAEPVLQLSDEQLDLLFPHLTEIGFNARVLRLVVEEIAGGKRSLGGLYESLEHAEFALENGPMKDRAGREVDHPFLYIKKSLLKTGYFDNPKGFLTIEERQLRDLKERREASEKALKEMEELAFKEWVASLSEGDKRVALAKIHIGGPEMQRLRQFWRTTVHDEHRQ